MRIADERYVNRLISTTSCDLSRITRIHFTDIPHALIAVKNNHTVWSV